MPCRPQLLSILLFASFLIFRVDAAEAQTLPDNPSAFLLPSSSDLGGIGLLQTRTARFAPDGQFELGFSKVSPYTRYLLNIQALPWLEATFRYTEIENRSFFTTGVLVDGESTFKDRGADVRLRLAKERRFLPAMAIGVQDGLGTGQFSGEYFVMSKRYRDLDFSLGLGWGNIGARGGIKNPFASISDAFKSRSAGATGSTFGGTLSFGSWFTGPEVGLFGGVEYQTPIRGLSLKLEYDGNNYLSEPLQNQFPQATPFNFGVNYRPFPWIEVSGGLERGREFMFRTTLRSNFNAEGVPKFRSPPPDVKIRARTSTVAPARPIAFSVTGGPARDDPLLTKKRIVLDGERVPAPVDDLFTVAEAQQLAVIYIDYAKGEIDLGVVGNLTAAGASIVAQAARQVTPANDGIVRVRDLETGLEFRYPVFAAVNLLTTPAVPARGPMSPSEFKEIFANLVDEGLAPEALDVRGSLAILRTANVRYRHQAHALGRAFRVLAAELPPSVEEMEVAMTAGGVEIYRIRIFRSDLEDAVALNGSPEEILSNTTITAGLAGTSPTEVKNPGRYPRFSYSISPFLRQHIGGGDSFYAYALSIGVSAHAELLPGLSVSTRVARNITDTFDRLRIQSFSALPHVRSDIVSYLQGTSTPLIRLKTDYVNQLDGETFYRLSAGYFEEMFGGYSGEVLYRPFGARFAGGIDLNYVRQRDFKQRFGFRDYSVWTGHLSVYYDAPFKGLLLQAHMGQFLAGDRGVLFQVSRLFDSGIRAGAFATFTDVPFEIFGEGSFDKGFFLAIPFDLFLLEPTRRSGSFGFRPLTKDGGQMLSVGPRLYDLTAQGNVNHVVDKWSEVLQ